MSHERKEGSLDEVLALLYKGETIKLSFSTEKERETARKILYRKKAQQDEAIMLLLEEDKQVLRCYRGQGTITEDLIYFLTCFLEKEMEKTVSFEILSGE